MLASADSRSDDAWFALHPWMPWRERPTTADELQELHAQGIAVLPGVRIRVSRTGVLLGVA